MSINKKLGLYLRGFFSYSYILYGFKNNNPKLYISDIEENIKARHINKKDLLYIDNKIIFPLLVKPFASAPKEGYVLKKGHLLTYDSNIVKSIDEFIDDLKHSRRPVILKFLYGAGGEGIFRIEFKNNDYQLNGVVFEKNALLQKIRGLDDYIISEFIEQHSYAANFYPETINTIRLLTLVDPDSNEPFIAAAAHRIGNSRSFPVDNCGKGGFTAAVDLETGKLGPAVSTLVESKELIWHSTHPESGNPIEGVVVPDWEDIKTNVLAMSRNIRFLPLLGWDLVITPYGMLVIETNDGPDLKLHQVHQPLLIDERIKRFFKFHNVIN